MAHHKSAKKRIRRNDRRRVINHARKSRVRTSIKKVEQALAAGDQTTARDALKSAEPEMMRAAQKGAFHRNTMQRKLSRLSARVKALA